MTTKTVLQCPRCGADNHLTVQCKAAYRLEHDGRIGELVSLIGEEGYPQNTDFAICDFEDCGWEGTFADLYVVEIRGTEEQT